MAVNQSQVDHIITAASEDDPEVKLQNLEREVDLIKTSIKRLLMDIRERMNELENPFTLTATGAGGAPLPSRAPTAALDSEVDLAKKSALEAREAALDARESQIEATTSKTKAENAKKTEMENERRSETEADRRTEIPVSRPQPVQTPPVDDRRIFDEQMLAVLRSQAVTPTHKTNNTAGAAPVNEKIRLQKVYKLFKWTHQSVKKFGHDRLEIILESYRAMGYISKESCDEIREISRLMPANIGEEHEVGPDEFVSELYALNRILAPNDTSLDRDMIEVMMEQRQQEPLSKDIASDTRSDTLGASIRENKSPSRTREKDEEWMNLPDRI
jgi:hypothetical protein